jgi:hypothetical protein
MEFESGGRWLHLRREAVRVGRHIPTIPPIPPVSGNVGGSLSNLDWISLHRSHSVYGCPSSVFLSTHLCRPDRQNRRWFIESA